jgi:hypothetical protein
MSAEDAYKRAFHCGAGGHDGHPGDDFGNLTNPDDQVYDDRCALAVEWGSLKKMVKDQSELIIELGAKLNAVKLRLEEKQDETCEFCDEGAPCCEKFDNSYGEMLRPTITVCTACWNKAVGPKSIRQTIIDMGKDPKDYENKDSQAYIDMITGKRMGPEEEDQVDPGACRGCGSLNACQGCCEEKP